MVIRDRRHLSEDGFVLPIIAINKHTGQMESLPEIVSRGFIVGRWTRDVMQEARAGGGAGRSRTRTTEEKTDWGVMQEKIRADLKRYHRSSRLSAGR